MENSLDIIKYKSILSFLTDQELKSLLSVSETIQLKNNEILFYKGDLSRDIYIVISGKLITTLFSDLDSISKENIFGYIMPGDLVGEMSLLTGAPRSLTVLAGENSSLLKISQDNFNIFFQHNSEVAFKILKIVIERAQDVIKQLDKTPEAESIAFVPINPSIRLDELISQLQNVLPNDSNLFILSNMDLSNIPDQNLLEQFGHLKRNKKKIIYSIDLSFPTHKIDYLIAQSSKIILVATGTEFIELDNTTSYILRKNVTNRKKMELVLLHEKTNGTYHETEKWLQIANFSRHHHISLSRIEDIKRLARFLNGSAIGLVLGGGGLMRGWAHIGVLKYLLEKNIPFDAIGGTSIGAILGASYIMDMDLDHCIERYEEFRVLLGKGFNLRSTTLPIISIFNGKTATTVAQKWFPDLIENLPLPFFCISCNISQKTEVIHKYGFLWEAIRATYSLPGLIPPLVINHQLHVDGAVVNNLPVNVMSDYLENSGTIIAVSLSHYAPYKPDYSFPPYISFWNSLLIKLGIQKNYRFPHFFNTLFDSLLIGSNLQQQANMQKADILILPEVSQYSTLSRTGSSEEMIKEGYEAAKLAFERRDKPLDF